MDLMAFNNRIGINWASILDLHQLGTPRITQGPTGVQPSWIAGRSYLGNARTFTINSDARKVNWRYRLRIEGRKMEPTWAHT